VNAGDAVKKCGFTGTVGTDKRDDFTLKNFEIQAVQRSKPPEIHGQIFYF
jgi:hypothetical protein